MLTDALKLLHPYMPFITEEIFCTLQSAEESIMISRWPVYLEARSFIKEEKEIEIIKEAVRGKGIYSVAFAITTDTASCAIPSLSF